MKEELYNTEIDDEVGEVLRAGCASVVAFIAAILLALGVISLLGSCTTTKYVTMPEVHTDTVMIMKQQRDSIYLKDSIYVSEKQNGDTILLTTIKWSTRYIDRWRTDTIYQSRVDSIPVPYTVEKQVPAQLTPWQKFRIWIGDFVIIAMLLLFIYAVWKAIRITP